MAMNIYDKINDLADSLKKCDELQEYLKVKEEVYKNPEIKEKVEDFRKKQIEVQKMAVDGNEEEAKAKYEILQQLYTILQQNPDVKRLFDSEVKFDMIVGDMYRILGEAVKGALED